MAKLIVLTTSYTGCKCQVIAINVDCIRTVGFSDYKSISYHNTRSMYVQEDVNTIVALCNND